MITKGIIQTIDSTTNAYNVRVPIFEGAGNKHAVVLTATAAINPGHFAGYQQNDVVFIGFENNDINSPVILGKLYLGAQNETTPRGIVHCENLKIYSEAELPLNTRFSMIQQVADNPVTCNSLSDLVQLVQKQQLQIEELTKLIEQLQAKS